MPEAPPDWDDERPATPPPARPRRAAPAAVGLVLALVIVAYNLSALTGELRLRAEGVRTVMLVDRCDHGTCSGSYEVGGVVYRDRLLLAGDQARAGQRVPVLVNASHPGDASTTGWAAAVEAGLLAAVGAVIAVIAGRRALLARRQRGRRPGRDDGPGGRRSLAGRARVWESPGDDEEEVSGRG